MARPNANNSQNPGRKRTRPAMNDAARRAVRYYPFGFAGSALFIVSVYLFGHSVVSKNAYGLVLSVAALFVLFVLALLGRIQAERLARSESTWDFSPALYARNVGPSPRAAIDGPGPLLFFRLHALLRGTLVAGRTSRFSFLRDVATADPHHIELSLLVPFCGRLELRTSFHIGDVFGLTRSRFGHIEEFALPVQPSPFPGSQVPPIQAAGGDRETSRTRQPDEERYYQREYVPGDRFRDINWKASSRLTQLFTRTSPVTQDQTQLLTIYFRHYLPQEQLRRRESLELLAHLNILKSWLVAYLFRVKREHPEFHFRVVTARGTAILETEEDIHAFSASISDLEMESESLTSPEPENPDGDRTIQTERESTIFTTCYDEGLSAFLHSRPAGRITVYRTVFDERGKSGAALNAAASTSTSTGTTARRAAGPAAKPEVRSATESAASDDATVPFSVLGTAMFPTLAAFLPLGLLTARERMRKNPAVFTGAGVELIERTVVLQV